MNIKVNTPIFLLPNGIDGEDILRIEKEMHFTQDLKLSSRENIRFRSSCFDTREDAYSFEDLIYDELMHRLYEAAKEKERERVLSEQRELLINIYNNLPETEQKKLLGVARTFQSKAQRATPPLPPIGGSYERFDSFAANWTKERLRAYTGRVWGSWLKAFTPSLAADAISRNELMERDPALMRKLVRDFPAGELATIIQTKSQRLDAEAALVTIDAAASGDMKRLRSETERVARRKQRAGVRMEAPEPT